MVNLPAPMCPPPLSGTRAPAAPVPTGACDSHAHILGPLKRWPYAATRGYTPPEAMPETYRRLMARLGVSRAVLVQPSVYGTDNGAMLAALAEGGGRFRGVAVVDGGVDEVALRAMDEAGVRGLRINLLFAGGGVGLELARDLADRIASLGWHLQVLLDVSATPGYARHLGQLPVPLVVDHIGHLPVERGVGDPGFRDLLALVREGRTWVKLSAPYRLSPGGRPPWPEVRPFVDALVATRPDRMLWASDWPHVAIAGAMPDDADLIDTLAAHVPDETIRRLILVDNPAALYGFV